MSRESHNDVVTRQGMSDGDARLFAGEKALIFLVLPDVFRKYLIIRAFWQRCNIWQSSHILLGHWVLCYFAIEYYAPWSLSIMLLGHWVLCSLGFSYIFLSEVSLLRSGTKDGNRRNESIMRSGRERKWTVFILTRNGFGWIWGDMRRYDGTLGIWWRYPILVGGVPDPWFFRRSVVHRGKRWHVGVT